MSLRLEARKLGTGRVVGSPEGTGFAIGRSVQVVREAENAAFSANDFINRMKWLTTIGSSRFLLDVTMTDTTTGASPLDLSFWWIGQRSIRLGNSLA